MTTYHADRSRVSNSSLKLFARAPILWKLWRDGELPETRSDDLVFGALLHCLALEPDRLHDLFAALPEDAPKKPTKQQLAAWLRFKTLTKPTKQQVEAYDKTDAALRWWNDYTEKNKGKDSIGPDDIAKAEACFAGLLADPLCRAWLMLSGLPEVEIQWTDEETGLPCKAKLDKITAAGIIDIKTTGDATTEAFTRSAIRYGYHRQAAFYLDGVTAALRQGTIAPWVAELLKNQPPERFIFTAVEKDEPNLAHCFVATEPLIERGRAENKAMMRRLKECIDSDKWPGLSTEPDGMTPLYLPAYLPPIQ